MPAETRDFHVRDAVRPDGWDDMPQLVCGFGDRFCDAPGSTLLLERQVHGSRVARIGDAAISRSSADGYDRLQLGADALIAASPGVVVGVRTADCVPLLLLARGAHWAAAVHAGWKGTLAGIVRKAVAAAAENGVQAGELEASLGPSIGPCCYEVSGELGRQFEEAGLGEVVSIGPRGKPHLDLRLANRRMLEGCGVAPQQIAASGPCTRCAHERYHSFRADPGSSGRQISWIGWRS